ncbi:hypothetical protein Ancab_007846 [Ancistrocladus abbreviatus]
MQERKNQKESYNTHHSCSAAMNTLASSSSSSLSQNNPPFQRGQSSSRSRSEYHGNHGQQPRSSSKSRYTINLKASATFCSRSLRAKRRQAFLKTYTLSSFDDNPTETQSKSQKLKQAASKVKSVMVSLVAAVRLSFVTRFAAPRYSIAWPSSPISDQKASFLKWKKHSAVC